MNDMRGSVYSLTQSEQDLVIDYGTRIHEWNLERRENCKVGDGDDLQIRIEGLGAEVAYCNIYGMVFPEVVIGIIPEYDVVREGRRIDVKQTERPNGRLLVPLKKRNQKTDFYALMTGVMPSYTLAGHASKQKVLNSKPRSFGYGPNYWVDQSNMKF